MSGNNLHTKYQYCSVCLLISLCVKWPLLSPHISTQSLVFFLFHYVHCVGACVYLQRSIRLFLFLYLNWLAVFVRENPPSAGLSLQTLHIAPNISTRGKIWPMCPFWQDTRNFPCPENVRGGNLVQVNNVAQCFHSSWKKRGQQGDRKPSLRAYSVLTCPTWQLLFVYYCQL